MNKKSVKEISLERGSVLLTKKRSKKSADNQTSQRVAHEFVSHNKRGSIRVFVAGGSRSGNDKIYNEEAFKLGEEIARKNYRLDFGLSSTGIMGAVAGGVLKVWGGQERKQKNPIKGVTTKEYLALYKNDAVLDAVSDIIVAHTLEERKKQLLAADFVLFAPGGVGTLDELFYDCVAMQDGFLPFKPFVLFNVNGYFHHLLEFLKDMTVEGFADPIPFIVVDDSFEASVAFDAIGYYDLQKNKAQALSDIRKLIYDLPYLIEQRRIYPKKKTVQLLKEMQKTLDSNKKEEIKNLQTAVEISYLNKEITRMNGRLSKTQKDTGTVGRKLIELTQRFRNRMK
ncbi:MAG: LOG family protein [Lactobacillales bacterium]|jgi:uncharacterized protein (TIGR00730 family)|nr:LOG family protein [Lactobacillales bacterium]